MKKGTKRKRGKQRAPLKAAKSRGPRARFWVFTDNGAKGTKGKDLVPEAWKVLPDNVRYLTWQYERAPTTGQLHLQGYIELRAAQYVRWLHRHISETARFLIRRGTQEQATTYTHKEESRLQGPWELGQPTEGAGSRTDLERFRDAIATGATLTVLKETHIIELAKYGRLYDRLRMLVRPVRREGPGPNVTLLIGIPGTGKTKAVYDEWELDDQFYELPSVRGGIQWIDGYDGHMKVLIDEFTGAASRMDLDILLKLIDTYPRRMQVKGSFTHFHPSEIQITTNVHPLKWYNWDNRQAQYLALKRRFTRVLIFFDINKKPLVADDDFWWDEELNPPPKTVYKRDRLNYEALLGLIWSSSHKPKQQCDHAMNYCVNNCDQRPWHKTKWYNK